MAGSWVVDWFGLAAFVLALSTAIGTICAALTAWRLADRIEQRLRRCEERHGVRPADDQADER